MPDNKMLSLPSNGVSLSIHKHNCKLEALCDWVEAAVLFDNDCEELSAVNLVDALIESQIYDDQGFAYEVVSDVLMQLRERARLLQDGYPFILATTEIRRKNAWADHTGYAYCLLVSSALWYPGFRKLLGPDYNEQGALFEELVERSLKAHFPNWAVFRVGWQPQDGGNVLDRIRTVAREVGEAVGDLQRLQLAGAGDLSLDLLLHRPYVDGRTGPPVFLMQCATGLNWRDKLHSPNINRWKAAIRFTGDPYKAFACPFAMPSSLYDDAITFVGGMLIDRLRVFAPSSLGTNWIGEELEKKLLAWLAPRVPAFLGA